MKNVGSMDKTIRVIAGLTAIVLGFIFKSWWGAIGILPLVTAFLGWCPAYSLLGIKTCGTSSCCGSSPCK